MIVAAVDPGGGQAGGDQRQRSPTQQSAVSQPQCQHEPGDPERDNGEDACKYGTPETHFVETMLQKWWEEMKKDEAVASLVHENGTVHSGGYLDWQPGAR